MKRFALLILAILGLTTGQVFAQDTNLIIMNDSNPSISAAINQSANATGVVTIDLNMAAVTLTDASGGVVFSSADPRVHHLELNIVPNSGSHTLTIERLPGAALASAQIGSQTDLTPVNPPLTTLADTNPTIAGQHTLNLDATHPAGQVALDIQPNTMGLVTATFPDAVVMSQLTDVKGALIATVSHDISGFNMLVDGGQYDLNVQDNSVNTVNVAISATSTNQFTLLSAPQQTTSPIQTNVRTPCTATIATSSANLRSGPGTGYSVLNAASQGTKLEVGGANPEQNWVVVAANGGSGWVERDLAQLNGDCNRLQVFNIPLLTAQAAPVIVQSVPSGSAPIVSNAHHENDGSDDNQHQSTGGDHESSGGDD